MGRHRLPPPPAPRRRVPLSLAVGALLWLLPPPVAHASGVVSLDLPSRHEVWTAMVATGLVGVTAAAGVAQLSFAGQGRYPPPGLALAGMLTGLASASLAATGYFDGMVGGFTVGVGGGLVAAGSAWTFFGRSSGEKAQSPGDTARGGAALSLRPGGATLSYAGRF